MSTNIDLTNATGVGPFDITGLGMIPNNRVPYTQQIVVSQNGGTVATSAYSLDAGMGTITFSSDITGLDTNIRRDTPRDLAVTFTDAARLPAADLNDAFTQTINLVDEVIADPVSHLDLADLSDVGGFGDAPTDNDILVYDNGLWVFEARDAVNAVTATNVSVAFNSSNAELTLYGHDTAINTIADQAQDISHSGNVTQLGQDGRILGDLDVVGTLTFGALGSDVTTTGTYTGAALVANTVNGATGITMTNTGSGRNDSVTLDFANSLGLSTRLESSNGSFYWYNNSSSERMRLASDGGLYAVNGSDEMSLRPAQIGTTNVAFGMNDGGTWKTYWTGNGRIVKTQANASSGLDVLNRNELDGRYLRPQVSNSKASKAYASPTFEEFESLTPGWMTQNESAFAQINATVGMFSWQSYTAWDNSVSNSSTYDFDFWIATRANSSAQTELTHVFGVGDGSYMKTAVTSVVGSKVNLNGSNWAGPSNNGHSVHGTYRRTY